MLPNGPKLSDRRAVSAHDYRASGLNLTEDGPRIIAQLALSDRPVFHAGIVALVAHRSRSPGFGIEPIDFGERAEQRRHAPRERGRLLEERLARVGEGLAT